MLAGAPRCGTCASERRSRAIPIGRSKWRSRMLRDAAAVVPEILERAEPVLHEDAALIDAEIVIGWARELIANPIRSSLIEPEEQEEYEARQRRNLEATVAAAMERVAKTDAKTARGRAIKAAMGFLA